MAEFSYIIRTPKGSRESGEIKSENYNTALDELQVNGNTVIKLTERDTSFDFIKPFLDRLSRALEELKNRVPLNVLVFFTRQLSTMFSAGLTIERALYFLSTEEKNKKFKKILLKIADNVKKGLLLSSALENHPGVFSNLYVSYMEVGLTLPDITFFPFYLTGFFKSVGAILFLPYVSVGLLIFISLFFFSRIIPIMAIMGYLIGASVTAAFTGHMIQSFLDTTNFNYILVAIALGCIYLVPSIKSYLIAAMSVLMTTLLVSAIKIFWSYYLIPVFTLPFNIMTLSMVYILGLLNFAERPLIFKKTPEQTLDYFISTQERFGTFDLTLSLPFLDTWTVWQGFDGDWTHQGVWKYGYDFVKSDANDALFKDKGHYLEDYYCYKQPVHAPITGRVIAVQNSLPDNPIGSVDTINNWGNYIIIAHDNGHYAELSHLSTESIIVKEGQWVTEGDYLGLCGNSGYSPQPHLHIQVQASPTIGSATIPFKWQHYVEGGHFRAKGLPKENTKVSSLQRDLFYDQLTSFSLDDQLNYQVKANGGIAYQQQVTVKMAPDGTFFFESNETKLYFGKQWGSFFCYNIDGKDPLMKALFQVFSCVPLGFSNGLHWQDTLPDYVVLDGWQSYLSSLIKLISPKATLSKVSASFLSETIISGIISNKIFNKDKKFKIKLNPNHRIESFELDHMEVSYVQDKA